MKKKILSVVLAVAMAGTMLAGCGAKKEAKNKNSNTEQKILNKNKIYNNKQKKYFKYIILLNTKQY